MSLPGKIKYIYDEYGQRKEMGRPSESTRLPHFFLHRIFAGENDLLIIFNTKRCAYQCHFCQLPAKSSKTWVSSEDVLAQFEHVIFELKHSLSVLDRITLSNEGSVLDTTTFPEDALLTIAKCVQNLRRVRTFVFETRLEFVNQGLLEQIKDCAPRPQINILTGFETLDSFIRDQILFKREHLQLFLSGLDQVTKARADLTAYILYKPSPIMTDQEAFEEAEKSFDFLRQECGKRNIPYSVRLNPMYLAKGSKWADLATKSSNYKPPKLTDVMKLAEKKVKEGIKVYIGISNEGLGDVQGTYMAREDYSSNLIKAVLMFNNGKIKEFN